jgi:hypothetical protein
VAAGDRRVKSLTAARRIGVRRLGVITAAFILTGFFNGCASVGTGDKIAVGETAGVAAAEERVGRWALTIRPVKLTPANPAGVGPAGKAGTLEPGELVYIRSAVSMSERRYIFVTPGPDASPGGWADEADIAALPVYAAVRSGEGPVVLTESPRGEGEAAALVRSEAYLRLDDIGSGGGAPEDVETFYHAVLEDGREGWLRHDDIAFFDLFYARVLRLTEGFFFPVPGADRRTVESVHGPPAERERAETPNIHHPEITDVIHRYVYPGMGVRFYEAVSTGEEFVTSLVITSGRYRLPFGIGVGMSGDRLVRVLGEPHYRQGDRWVYTNALYDRGEPPKTITCTVRAGSLTEIALMLD